MTKPAVLVVDDNPLIVQVVSSLLASEDYAVYSSENGSQALEILDKTNVDLIICDVMMPRMDGYQFHDVVRKNCELSHIPFIFLTALGDSDEIQRGREAGADDYLIKPFDPRELLSVVKGKIVRCHSLKKMAEEKFESYRRKVIHTLSHEFRTPLVAINTGAEIILDQQDHLDKKRLANLLEAIRRGGVRLERLVSDFMILQQIEAGITARMFETKRKRCMLHSIAVTAIESDREMLNSENFKITVSILNESLEVEVYEPHILDVLRRLIENGVKFSPTLRDIEIAVYKQEKEGVIEVRDRGIGIDVKRLEEAIDVFGQLDREKLEQQGGGLGLAIAARYLEINKGRLEFSLRDGGGSKVSIILPLRNV